MRQHVVKLAPAFLVGGCSLIYNPSNIDKPMHDARMIDMGETPVDVEIRADASPQDLELTEAFPTIVNEGAGHNNSRQAVVVLRGRHFVKDAAANLVVTLSPANGPVVLDSYEVAGNGDYIALGLVVPVDNACDEGAPNVPIDVTVAQNDGAGGTVMKTLTAAFAVKCLDQLTSAPGSANNLRDWYSVINLPAGMTLGEATDAAILRSVSTITLGAVDVSASNRLGGPGGGTGGTPGVGSTATATAGGPGTGPQPGAGGAAGSGAGAGGGYVTAGTGTGAGNMTGDIWISSYATNRSSGGGGGGGANLGLPPPDGGAGGGGGGTLELTAYGPISVGAITANGAAGGDTAAGDGGAGTGGTVVIRTTSTLTVTSVSVAKGGATSSDGRVRVDIPGTNHPAGATKGPMFDNVPTRVTLQQPTLNLRGKENDDTATLRVFDKMGNAVGGGGISTYTPVFGQNGTAQVMPTLKAGYNKICVWVAGGSPATDESINCLEVAYLPQ